MENLADKYAHIKGWGIDANPENDPTYPMKHWNGDDHKRLNYERPELQPVEREILRSIERPNISAVYGDTVPPSGLSGMIRRHAFTYSESNWGHWLFLILADRINICEGVIDDIAHGYIPNVFAERGWNAEWEHNRKGMITKIAVGAAVVGLAAALLYRRSAARRNR